MLGECSGHSQHSNSVICVTSNIRGTRDKLPSSYLNSVTSDVFAPGFCSASFEEAATGWHGEEGEEAGGVAEAGVAVVPAEPMMTIPMRK